MSQCTKCNKWHLLNDGTCSDVYCASGTSNPAELWDLAKRKQAKVDELESIVIRLLDIADRLVANYRTLAEQMVTAEQQEERV
jgi:hypothetical protein